MTADPTGIKIDFDPTRQRMTGVTYHGDTPFDVPFVTEIAPNLWQGGCRKGLMLPRFFRHVVSLYPWEQYKVKHELDSAFTIRAYDSLEQGTAFVPALATWVNACRETGPVLVHCQAGLNRSSLVTAMALIQEGSSGDEAIALIREKRSPACLCNPAFEAWLRQFDDSSLTLSPTCDSGGKLAGQASSAGSQSASRPSDNGTGTRQKRTRQGITKP
jgi:protein-tyrosine phosphatase